jgi:predicted nucleic acid-binding protein
VPATYVLDSNIYIDAQRSRDENDQLRRFLVRAGSRVRVAAVVAMELRAGARSPAQVDVWRALIAPYQLRAWVLSASFDAWTEAGRLLAELGARNKRGGIAPSLTADVLLAVICREAGATLVTRNARDFAAIQRQLRGFRFVEPWPR